MDKASATTLAMCAWSAAITALSMYKLGMYNFLKLVAIEGVHFNMLHILRDHSISGLTHHGAHNVGEFDKFEFCKANFLQSVPWTILMVLGVAVPSFDYHIFNVLGAFIAIKCIAYVNHTMTHYTWFDIKNKGPGIKSIYYAQKALATFKIITSREYHAKHHFHNEMSYPAILITLNEYCTAKSLYPFLTRKMTERNLKRIEAAAWILYLGTMVGSMSR